MDEKVRFIYIKDKPVHKTERPFVILASLPEGFPESNIEYEDGAPQDVVDVRGRETELGLETIGFTFRSWILPNVNFASEAEILSRYIPSVKALVSQMIDGEVRRIELFDWRKRHSRSPAKIDEPNAEGSPQMTKIAPAKVVHVDQSEAGVLDRIRRYFGDQTNELVQNNRIRIVNVWKPLVDVVEDTPLALCDARKVQKADLVEVEFVLEDYVRRTYMAKYSDHFRFYYLSRMTKDEVCVFKVFDSANVEAKYVPHAAFEHSGITPETTARESIEVRLLVATKC